MKKGFYCPSCYNGDTGKLDVIIPERKKFTVLAASQKDIKVAGAKIQCGKCNHKESVMSFIGRKIIASAMMYQN
jgi:hypothetical protein